MRDVDGHAERSAASADAEQDDVSVQAVGAITEALETVERARGCLYSFHQLTGSADFKLDQVVELLRAAGAADLADLISTKLIGRNVLPGRWTYQVLEEYDDGYYAVFREMEEMVRGRLAGGERHPAEAAMKRRRVTPGEPGHELD